MTSQQTAEAADTEGTNGRSSLQPIYLLSTERSGSNLTRSILNTHTAVSAPHPLETTYPRKSTAPLDELGPSKTEKLVRDVIIAKAYSFQPLDTVLDTDSVYERVWSDEGRSKLSVQRGLYEEVASHEGSSAWVSKHPGIWNTLDEALAYYDDLKFVYLVRDARDMALSCTRSNIAIHHPYFAAERWQREQERGLQLLKERPESVHLLRYEDLLQEPEQHVEEICRFLDIEYQEEMLYYYETEEAQDAAERSDAFENLSVPIKSDNYGKYKDGLSDEHVKIVEKVASDELRELGYELEHDASELDAFELETDRYAKEAEAAGRRSRLEYWRESPVEQLRRFMSSSFGRYMIMRYGVFA